MKESRIQRYTEFISFVQETEGYRMNEEALQIIHDVLDGKVGGDEAILSIIEKHGLTVCSYPHHTIDGCYPNSDLYINHFGIDNQELLDEIEVLVVSARMAEILLGPQEWSYDFEHLKMLHSHLFQDLYPFAGEIRSIPITRRTLFCLPQYIGMMADEIFGKLREYQFLQDQDIEEFVDNLAYFMAEVHALHPFLDGNTRTMRLFFQQLSYDAGWELRYVQTTDSRLLEADIAALEGDYQPLISILHEAVEPLK